MSQFDYFLAVVCLLGQVVSQPVLNGDGRPVVDVSQGKIIGFSETQGGVDVLGFRAIPYAEPPVGPLRFMPPVPAGSFTGDLEAVNNPDHCPHIGKPPGGKEDCLYLNVYTPVSALKVRASAAASLPVMVWIHGGGFQTGNIEIYGYVAPLINKDVIVVMMQYRLGVLGFFSTGDDVVPGNMGLQDQTLAIKWVKDNIAAFGGNPDMITLFGQSAGSASTHYQMLTPFATGLFNGAIMMSGNAFDPWAYGRRFYNVSRDIAASFKCPLEPSSDLITCLQSVDGSLLAEKLRNYLTRNKLPFIFGPRVDGTYIPDEPEVLVRKGLYNQVPTIAGTVKDEMAFVVAVMFLFPSNIDVLVSDFDKNGPESLQLLPNEVTVKTAHAVYDHYLGGINITKDTAAELCKMYTDNHFAIHHDWLIQSQGDISTTYIYQYDYRATKTSMDEFYAEGLDLPAGKDWISHGDDIGDLFSAFPKKDPNDSIVQDTYVTLFTNFAKFGNPTPDSTLLGFQWPPATSAKLNHLSINVIPLMSKDKRQADRIFWESLPLAVNRALRPSTLDLSSNYVN